MAIRQKIRHNLAYLGFLAVLITCSGFFTWRVEAFRARTTKVQLTAELVSGTEVVVERIIDGDEITVRTAEGQSFVVRLLDIKAFEPGANDPGIGIFGQSCVALLEQALAGKHARIVFDELATDRSNRVLAYVERDDRDMGKVLVERGLAPVFTSYPFSREAAYLQVQAEARAESRGLWGVPKAAERAEALFELWNAERRP